MPAKLIALSALCVLFAACDPRSTEPPLSSDAPATKSPSTTEPVTSAPDPSSSDSDRRAESPAAALDEAESAAAAAPECKDGALADGQACNPAATGNPHAK